MKSPKPDIPPYLNSQIDDLPNEKWEDLPGLEGYGMISNLGRVKRLPYEHFTSDGRISFYKERMQKPKISAYFNQFIGDKKAVLQTRIQVEKVAHTISIGRYMYYCFIEKFDLQDRSIYLTYKDGNGLNLELDNLVKTDLSGLMQMIMQRGRKDLHFGHSLEKQMIISERNRKAFGKKVSQYDLTGKYVATYESLADATEKTGIGFTAISCVARRSNGALTAGNFIWRFGSSKKPVPVKKILHTKTVGTRIAISQYDLDGNRMASFNSISQAAAMLSIRRESIRETVNGRIMIGAGFIWRKGSKDKIDTTKERNSLSIRRGNVMSQYDLKGKKVITFLSSYEAARYAGVQNERINAIAVREDILLNGFIWRHGDQEYLAKDELQRVMSYQRAEKSRWITQYDLKGKRHNIFPSIKMAAEENNIGFGQVSSAVNGYKATGGGYIWRRGKGKAKINIPVTPRPLGSMVKKVVKQFTLKGKLIKEFPSIRKASEHIGIHYTYLGNMLKANSDVVEYKGYRWVR